jgi:hypothetical protein
MSVSGSIIGRNTVIPDAKVFATIGLETTPIKGFAFYARRGLWYHFNVLSGRNLKFNSQINYLGLSYAYQLKNEDKLILGLHHVWNATRGLQYYDNAINDTITNENLWFIYDNRGIGLDLRYRLKESNFDFSINCDYYYTTRHDFPSGFNAESLRLGILYNL